MKLFHKSSLPEISVEDASRILEQAFKANQLDTNQVPLEALISYSRYRRERFSMQRTLLVVIMTLFLLLPLLFIPASFTVKEDMSSGRDYNPVYNLTVDSFMLVGRVNATIDGYNIPIYEVDSHVYSIEPSRNGRMEVTVTLRNRQSMTQYVDVTAVDREVPVVELCEKREDLIYLYLSDAGSGIDFSSIRALDLTGSEVVPVSVDDAAGCVTFEAIQDTLNVYVNDRAGNSLQLIISMDG